MPTTHTATLEDLHRHGDLRITSTDAAVLLDLTVRRSNCVLLSSGDNLTYAIESMWNLLEEHLDAVDHLEDLGVDPAEIGNLTDTDERDSDLYSEVTRLVQGAVYGAPVEPAPAVAFAGEPIDTTSQGYILALLIPVREGRA